MQGVLLVDRMTPADKIRNREAVEELKDQYRHFKEAQLKSARAEVATAEAEAER